MPARRIIIIRHCDKPTDDSDRACNDTGYTRASRLAGFTGTCTRLTNVCSNTCQGTCAPGTSYWSKLLGGASPSALYAAVPRKVNKDCSKSNRMCLVLAPTAYCYKLTINPKGEQYCSDDTVAFAQYLTGPLVTGTVIVAWEHKNIIKLIKHLGVSGTPKWAKKDDDRYDLVFDLDMSGTTPTLRMTTQGLGLPGDSTTVLPQTSTSAPAEPARRAPTSRPAETTGAPASTGGWDWLWWLAGGAVAFGLALYYLKLVCKICYSTHQ